MNDRIAVIDIGSNSVRCMIAEINGSRVRSLRKELNTTRLAEGQGEDRRLCDASMRRTAAAVIAYAEQMRKEGYPVFAYATSALREASNREDFFALLGDAVPVAVLSGEQEGELAYRGATGGVGTLIDIGGGSFQVVAQDRSFSAPIGCVRFRDRLPEGDPETMYAFLSAWADCCWNPALAAETPVTGVGGTITTLGTLLLGQSAYDPQTLSDAKITPEGLKALLDRLFLLGDRRKEHPLLIKRHNVILQGGTILRYLMDKLSVSEVTPSDRDGMEGFAEAILEQNV